MSARLRNFLIVSCGVTVALFVGWQIGNESVWLAACLAAVIALFLFNRIAGIAPDAFVAGLAIVGYLVGNRGFAQLSVPHLPLLPAEAVLGIGVPLLVTRAALRGVLPIRLDSINMAIVAFILLGSMRMPTDVRAYGAMALRDFATVYYAVFFFLAQDWSGDPRSARWIQSCFTIGLALALPAFVASTLWPDFIDSHLSVNGVPLIFAKSDIACVFMVTAAFWFLDSYVRTSRRLFLLLAIANFAGVALSDSRAAVVGLVVCAAWLVLIRFVFKSGRVLRCLALISAAGVLALSVDALVPRKPGETSHLFRIYESARTVVDFSGTYVPQSDMLSDKAGNNSFRTVWWKAVADETYDDGFVFGLGFGHDLAARFVETYYPTDSEEFSVRSPHNVLLTIFARMGLAGACVAMVIIVSMIVRTYRAAKYSPNHEVHPAWMGAWAIFVTACFGVVLEGPMGAIAFWTLLGLANGLLYKTEASAERESTRKAGGSASFDAGTLGAGILQ